MLSGHLVFVPVLPSHGLLAESRTATISHRVHLWCTRITGVLVATLSFWDFSWTPISPSENGQLAMSQFVLQLYLDFGRYVDFA